MTNYNERLDEVFSKTKQVVTTNYSELSGWSAMAHIELTDEAKQAILRWVADEVIGDDEEIVHHKTIQSNNDNQIIRNSQRQKQRNILARHGYKGGE